MIASCSASFGPVGLLCLPNAYTRKRGTTRISLLCSLSAHAGRGKKKAGGLLCSRKAAHQKQRWIATHAGPLLPERARNADYIFRSRAVLVQGRSRTSMATTPSRGDTSQLGRSIETRAR